MCRNTVQNFMETVWTAFEKFEIFMKRSGEKKRHDCISSRKIFPILKRDISGFRGILSQVLVTESTQSLAV